MTGSLNFMDVSSPRENLITLRLFPPQLVSKSAKYLFLQFSIEIIQLIRAQWEDNNLIQITFM